MGIGHLRRQELVHIKRAATWTTSPVHVWERTEEVLYRPHTCHRSHPAHHIRYVHTGYHIWPCFSKNKHSDITLHKEHRKIRDVIGDNIQVDRGYLYPKLCYVSIIMEGAHRIWKFYKKFSRSCERHYTQQWGEGWDSGTILIIGSGECWGSKRNQNYNTQKPQQMGKDLSAVVYRGVQKC